MSNNAFSVIIISFCPFRPVNYIFVLLAVWAFAGATLYFIFKVLYGVNRIEIGVPSARFDFVRFLYVQSMCRAQTRKEG